MNTNTITQRSSVTQSYFTDIYSIPQLKDSEMEEMIDKIIDRDKETLDLLVVSNLRFAISEAKRYQGLGLHLDDLISEANCGLIKAAQKYDPTTGFRFISYAVWWIRQSIIRAIAECGKTVRFPQNVHNNRRTISKAYRELEQMLERPPTEGEVAEKLQLTHYQVVVARDSGSRGMELNSPVISKEGGKSRSYLDLVADVGALKPDEGLEIVSRSTDIQKVFGVVTPREKAILEMYYGIERDENMTLEEIAEKLGLTRERVRQVRNKALNKIKRHPYGAILREWVN